MTAHEAAKRCCGRELTRLHRAIPHDAIPYFCEKCGKEYRRDNFDRSWEETNLPRRDR